MKIFIIDRFEGSYAVCEAEDSSIALIPKYKLPPNCKEGECIVQDADGIYQRNTEANTTQARKIRERMNRLLTTLDKE